MSKLPFTYVFSFSLFFIFLFSLLFFSSHFSPPLLIYSPPLFSLSAPTLTGSLRPSSRRLCLRRRCPIAPHHHPLRPASARRCPAAPPPCAARGKAVGRTGWSHIFVAPPPQWKSFAAPPPASPSEPPCSTPFGRALRGAEAGARFGALCNTACFCSVIIGANDPLNHSSNYP
jgi:hypothetical protein